MTSPQNILVLSGASLMRYPTMLNHRAYCDRHGYAYRFDSSPRKHVQKFFFHKLHALCEALHSSDWLFWLDDDAAFMQLDTPLETLVPEMSAADPGTVPDTIFCKSPVNNGIWTHISSGNFLIRNTASSHALLKACLATELRKVRDWWDKDKYGFYTGGDQDALVYQIETTAEWQAKSLILPYDRFNCRSFHFEQPDDHFLVHFTKAPGKTKLDQMIEFSARMGLDDFLLPPGAADDYAKYHDHLRLNCRFPTKP
ncbi:MAG: hypothetical protein ACRBEQ_05160 [Hyphomonas sp.]